MLLSIYESGFVKVPSASLRMVSFDTLEKEIESTHFSIVEQGITSSLPDFNDHMYAIVKKRMNALQKNRHKYYLKAHLISVCKYRKQLLEGDIDDTVKSCFL